MTAAFPLTRSRPSALTLLLRRVAARGPLCAPPTSGIDYYGDITHFAGPGARGYVVAPRLDMPPQPRSAGPDRWGWLAGFGTSGTGQSPDSEPPRFVHLRNGFGSGLSRGNHFVAQALELLSGLQHGTDHVAVAKRLAAIAAPQSVRGSPVATAFVNGVWSGLYLLMDHCLRTVRVSWEEVAADAFPELRVPDGQGGSAPLLSAFPQGYRHWLDRVATLPDNLRLPLLLTPQLDRTWGQAARLARIVRRGDAPIDWVDALCNWTPDTTDEPDGRWVALTPRGKDGLLGRRTAAAGSFDDEGGMRHAAPLALLMAAIAADRHIARHGQLLHELATRMSILPADPAMHQPWPDYDSAWIESARRLALALRSGPAPGPMAPTAGTRFAPGRWGATGFESWPVTLPAPVWSIDDDGPLLTLPLPLQALGSAVQTHLARWEASQAPCLLEAYRSLSDVTDPYELVASEDSWIDGDTLWMQLRPQTAPDGLLARLWQGTIEPDLATLRAWLVNGAVEGQPPFPVLRLRVDLLLA